MSDITAYESDTLVVEVRVLFDSGAPVTSLSGATTRASASRVSLGVVIETVDATTVVSGEVITCTWESGAMVAGTWRMQVEAAKSGYTKTVYENTIKVKPANPPESA